MNSPTLCLWAVSVALGFGCQKADETAKTVTPKTTDFGTGLNSVERTYDRPATVLIEVATSTLKSYKLKVESDRHDDLGGNLVAVRADGNKVSVKITSMDQDHTRVTIRVAPGNRELAEMIHQRISEKLAGQSVK